VGFGSAFDRVNKVGDLREEGVVIGEDVALVVVVSGTARKVSIDPYGFVDILTERKEWESCMGPQACRSMHQQRDETATDDHSLHLVTVRVHLELA
jgi:hypothetical protein